MSIFSKENNKKHAESGRKFRWCFLNTKLFQNSHRQIDALEKDINTDRGRVSTTVETEEIAS